MRTFEKFVARAIAATAALSLATAALAIDISGAGATFPFPIYSKWASAYKGASGNGLNYQSIGSGGGIKQIESKTVTFRRERHAAFGAGAEPLRVAAVSDRDRRRSSRCECSRYRPGRDGAGRPDLGRHLFSARFPSGMTRQSRSSMRASICRTR
jgi:hypothetical protein